MSKPLKIKLTVPEPCHEAWDKMTPDEQGRHCGHCNKSVIDFSKFTDKELLDFFTKTKEKICGRFTNFQLNRVITVPLPSNTSIFKRILFGTALTAGVAATAQSQRTLPNQANTTQTPIDSNKKVSEYANQPADTSEKHSYVVTDTCDIHLGSAIIYIDDRLNLDNPRPDNPDEFIFKKGDSPYW